MSAARPGDPLRAAVIGCGAIAYEHLPWLAATPQARLVALCDQSPALAQAARDHFGAGSIHVDAAAMLAEVKPDIVHVLTPPHSHDQLVRLALAAGAHVVCEKPMCGTAAETAALLDLARETGRSLVESRNLLFNDAILAIRGAIAEGRLGDVRSCDIVLHLDFLQGPFGDLNLDGPAVRVPAGAIHDFLPHLVYLFAELTGSTQIDAVHGSLENRSGNRRAGFDFLDVLVAAGAVRGRLRIATDVQPERFRLTVGGSRATVETDLYNPYLRFEGAPDVGKRAPLGQLRSGLAMARAGLTNLWDKVGQHGTMHGMPRMLDAVYSALRGGTALPITPDQILTTARMVDRIVALGDRA